MEKSHKSCMEQAKIIDTFGMYQHSAYQFGQSICADWFINDHDLYSYTMYRRNIDIFFVILAPVRDFDKLSNGRSCIARDVLVDY